MLFSDKNYLLYQRKLNFNNFIILHSLDDKGKYYDYSIYYIFCIYILLKHIFNNQSQKFIYEDFNYKLLF